MVFRRHTPGWFSLPFHKKAVPFCVGERSLSGRKCGNHDRAMTGENPSCGLRYCTSSEAVMPALSAGEAAAPRLSTKTPKRFPVISLRLLPGFSLLHGLRRRSFPLRARALRARTAFRMHAARPIKTDALRAVKSFESV